MVFEGLVPTCDVMQHTRLIGVDRGSLFKVSSVVLQSKQLSFLAVIVHLFSRVAEDGAFPAAVHKRVLVQRADFEVHWHEWSIINIVDERLLHAASMRSQEPIVRRLLVHSFSRKDRLVLSR